MGARYLEGALLLVLASVLLIGFVYFAQGQPTEQPVLVWPENGENINDNTPNLNWDPVTGADNYDVQVDNDPDYSSPNVNADNIGNYDNYQVLDENALPEGVYHWRVRGENADGLGPWSDNWVFRIDITVPPAPSLAWPADGENINDNTPNLDWDTVSDASSPILYRVHVSDNSQFPYDNVDSGWISDDNYITSELAEGVWYWRVQAIDNAGNVGDNSVTRSFRVDTVKPLAPGLISPDNGDNLSDNTPTLNWSAVPDNSLPVLYYAAVSDNSAFPYENRNSGWITDNQWDVSPALPNGVWYWRVRARDNAGNVGDNSDMYSFRVVTPPAAGVEISISPSSQSGTPDETLSYTVTVTNAGNVPDNYTLERDDTQGWPLTLPSSVGPLDPDESDDVTLEVTIPHSAENGDSTTVTVTATSQENTEIKDNDNCVARVEIIYRVKVTISPSENEGAPGATLEYTVTVKNEGNVEDTYDLEKDDNQNWTLTLSSSTGSIDPGDSVNKTLEVTIPTDAENCTRDNIIVTATSQENENVSDNDTCIAHAVGVLAPSVEVSISPDENWAAPGENVTFTVTVTNNSNVSDNYDLTVSDNENWGPTLDDNVLEDLSPDENGETTLRVTIPENAENCTWDKIIVTATSQTDNTVSDNDSCKAHAGPFGRGVAVSISPDYDNGVSCTTLEYTVTVRNTGAIDDNYDLSWSDNAGWGDNIRLGDNSLWVAHGDENSTTLYIHMPENVEPCTKDNITVTATSQENTEVSDNDSCIAHVVSIVRGGEVTISPSENEAPPGESVTFLVTVQNTGNVPDNYGLTVSDGLGWDPELDENLLEVLEDANRSTTLTVTIPEDTASCTRNNITVTATSVSENTISDSDSCIAHAVAEAAPSIWPTIAGTAIGAIAMIGTGVAFYMGGKPFSMRGPAAAGIVGGIVMIGGAIAGSPVIFGIGGALVIIGIVFAFYLRGRYF